MVAGTVSVHSICVRAWRERLTLHVLRRYERKITQASPMLELVGLQSGVEAGRQGFCSTSVAL
eukprot:1161955-Pelagomonas_calceolata.AAC.9